MNRQRGCSTALARLGRSGLLGVLLAGAACAGGAAAVRKHTYPPDFVYVERRAVRTVMWDLADGVARLDRGLNPEGGAPPDVPLVLEALRALDEASARLPEGTGGNHPMLGARTERFRRDIDLALASAQKDPPSLTLAASLTGACLYCHAAPRR